MDQNLIAELESLGCKNRQDAAITAQVFLELCEVKRYWDVEYKIHDTTNKLYLTGKQYRTASLSVFIPLATSINLNFAQLQDYLQFVADRDQHQKVFLVFVNADSTCVYYQISDGLCMPDNITVKHLKENKTEMLDAEIKRNAELIKQAAMCGIPVTLPKRDSTRKTQ